MALVLRDKWPQGINQILNHVLGCDVKIGSVIQWIKDVPLDEVSLAVISDATHTFRLGLHSLFGLIEIGSSFFLASRPLTCLLVLLLA